MGEGGPLLSCATCGPVTVEPSQVGVHENAREGFLLYAFACPKCGDLVAGSCRDRARLLLGAGARWHELRSTAAPPLTADDLIDLHEWLERGASWLDRPPAADPTG